MNRFKLFNRMLSANFKRLKNYILPILISILFLVSICSVAGGLIAKNMYKEGVSAKISIAFYLPIDDDLDSNTFGIDLIQNLDGTQEVVNLIQVDTIEEGYELLEDGKVFYYIIVPEMFFTGIMDSTNPKLTILFADNNDIVSYISNELFAAYARYLGVAQAGVYSAIDTLLENDTETGVRHALQDLVNMTFLDRSLNKDIYIDKQEATGEGSYSLLQHYMAVAVLLSLFFTSFVFMSYLQNYRKGMLTSLSIYGINRFHIFLSNFICSVPALYIAYIPCYILMSIINGRINIIGLIYIIPSILIISLVINVIASLANNQFAANMTILAVVLLITYIAGGIYPSAMLPEGVNDFSAFLPGEFLIRNIAGALFGV